MAKRLIIPPDVGFILSLLAFVVYACNESVSGSNNAERHGGNAVAGGNAAGGGGATVVGHAGASAGGSLAFGDLETGQAGTPAGGFAGSVGADPPTECFPSSITAANVVVLGDASPTGASIKGRLWVGGNLTLNATYSVNSSGATTTGCSEFGLIVGGDIEGDPFVEAGAVVYGGTLTGSLVGSCEGKRANPVDFVALRRQLEDYSAALRSLPVTGTVAFESDYLVFTSAATSLNVFNVDVTDFTSNNLKFAVPPSSSILVNVSGSAVTWIGKGFSFPDGPGTCMAGTSTWCQRILYNFHEADLLEIAGVAVQGSILAPRATIDAGCGSVDGQVVVSQLKGGYEYFPYPFTGCLRP